MTLSLRFDRACFLRCVSHVCHAGFDACIGDPLGGMEVTPKMFGSLAHQLMDPSICPVSSFLPIVPRALVKLTFCCLLQSGRLVVALEGGYNVPQVALSVTHCVRALLQVGTDQAFGGSAAPTSPYAARTEVRLSLARSFESFSCCMFRSSFSCCRMISNVIVPNRMRSQRLSERRKRRRTKTKEVVSL